MFIQEYVCCVNPMTRAHTREDPLQDMNMVEAAWHMDTDDSVI